MKFLVDAQLPRRLAREISSLGGDALHTLDLARQNRTTDKEIRDLVAQENRIVVSKDVDFVDSFFLYRKPARLLFISTGNIPNDELVALLRGNWPKILTMFSQGDFIELSRTALTLHV